MNIINYILFLLLADVPLAAGHYLENSSALKIKVEIAQPLVTVNQIAANEPIPTSSQVKDLCQDLFMAHYVFNNVLLYVFQTQCSSQLR